MCVIQLLKVLLLNTNLEINLERCLCHSHLMVWKDDLGLFSKLSPSFSTCSSLSRGVFALPFITSSPEPQNLAGKQTPEEEKWPQHCGGSNTSGSRETKRTHSPRSVRYYACKIRHLAFKAQDKTCIR